MEIVLEYSPLVGLLVGIATIVFVVARFGQVPDRLDALELEFKEMRIEHGERLAWIEGALSSNQPAPPDSTLAPVQTGALVSASEPAPATDE